MCTACNEDYYRELFGQEQQCSLCRHRIEPGQAIILEGVSSWGPLVFCSETCKAKRDLIRI